MKIQIISDIQSYKMEYMQLYLILKNLLLLKEKNHVLSIVKTKEQY